MNFEMGRQGENRKFYAHSSNLVDIRSNFIKQSPLGFADVLEVGNSRREIPGTIDERTVAYQLDDCWLFRDGVV